MPSGILRRQDSLWGMAHGILSKLPSLEDCGNPGFISKSCTSLKYYMLLFSLIAELHCLNGQWLGIGIQPRVLLEMPARPLEILKNFYTVSLLLSAFPLVGLDIYDLRTSLCCEENRWVSLSGAYQLLDEKQWFNSKGFILKHDIQILLCRLVAQLKPLKTTSQQGILRGS